MKNVPLYKFTFASAQAHGELEQARASHKANIACKEAIRQAIHDHYRDNCLDEAGAREVLTAFGAERTKYVLANTVQNGMLDARYCQYNKDWAKTIRICEATDLTFRDIAAAWVVNSHPGLIDIFITQVRIIAGD